MRPGRLATSLASGTLVMLSACTDLLTGPHSPRFENGRDDTIGEPIDPPAGFAGMIRIGVIAALNGSTPTTSITLGSPTSFTVTNKRSEEHTSELQSLAYLVCRLLLEKK